MILSYQLHPLPRHSTEISFLNTELKLKKSTVITLFPYNVSHLFMLERLLLYYILNKGRKFPGNKYLPVYMEINSLTMISHKVVVQAKVCFSLFFTLCPTTSVTSLLVSRLKEDDFFFLLFFSF